MLLPVLYHCKSLKPQLDADIAKKFGQINDTASSCPELQQLLTTCRQCLLAPRDSVSSNIAPLKQRKTPLTAPARYYPEPMNNPDYIVVGSGAAGAIVANRLCTATGKKRCTVCLIEAGKDGSNLYSRIPAAFSRNLQNENLMWQFQTAPADALGGRSVYIPQGKLLGGSTSINGLVYNRGQSADFDHWASLGNKGWAYRDVLPYFRRTETRAAALTDEDNPEKQSQYRGSHGPVHISDPDRLDPICNAFINTVASHNVPVHNDYNGASQRGTGYYQRFIKNGSRVSANTAFIEPVKAQPNLDIKTGVQVVRVIFNGKHATGVELADGRSIHANREVIICAGTVNSAKLLQISGVGPANLLKPLGIPIVNDLPGVGENFQDHYFIRVSARLKPSAPSLNKLSRGPKLLRELWRWQTGKPSILSYSPSIAYAFLNSSDLQDPIPDLQFVFTPGSYQPGKVYVLDKFPAATCGFTQQRPKSTGHIRITSNDPNAAPQVQPNYLQHDSDKQAALRGMKLSRQFLQSSPLLDYFANEEVPGAAVQSDEELLNFAKATGNTGYHLVGSCTMGPADNSMAVVGSDLKVHGVAGLRVVDASVMPCVTSSNTCAATMMIGEKGAELILEAVDG